MNMRQKINSQQELNLYYSKNKSLASLIIYGMLFIATVSLLSPILGRFFTSTENSSHVSYSFIYSFISVFFIAGFLLFNAAYKYLKQSPQITIGNEGIKFKENKIIPWKSIDEVTIIPISRRAYYFGPEYTGNVLGVVKKDNSKEYSVFLDDLDNYNTIGEIVKNYEKKFDDSAAIMYGAPLMEKQKEMDKDMNSIFMGTYKLTAIIIGPLVLILFAIYAYLL